MRKLLRSIPASLVAVVFVTAACSTSEGKKPEEKKPKEEKKVDAPIDPKTFVETDLSSVPSLAGHTVKALPGAKVIADATFGKPKPTGAVLAKDDFALHLWWSTTGGERTVLPIKAEMKGEGKYVETACNPDLCEYTIEAGGTKSHGFFRPVDRRDNAELSASDSQLLCGPAKEVATPEALAPYRAACDTVARKK